MRDNDDNDNLHINQLPDAYHASMMLIMIIFHFTFQIAWCGQVFADPVAVLSSLLIQILVHLEPPISECITENLNGEEASLELLIQLKQVGGVVTLRI